MVRPLGHFLVQDGVLTEDQLHRALVRQRQLAASGKPERFGNLIVALGFVTTEQLELALARQEQEQEGT